MMAANLALSLGKGTSAAKCVYQRCSRLQLAGLISVLEVTEKELVLVVASLKLAACSLRLSTGRFTVSSIQMANL
jgi:hypothetical protein